MMRFIASYGARIAPAMADNLPVARLQSPGELKARIEAEWAGAPFLLYRDGAGQQQIFTFGEEVERLTVGRGPANDIRLDADTEVSRLARRA